MTNRLAVKVHGDFYGYIEGDTFVKEVYGSRHKLRAPEAWAFDKESFDKLIRPSCTHVVVIDKEVGRRYLCDMATFVKNRGEIDRGHGKQYFLVMKHWIMS